MIIKQTFFYLLILFCQPRFTVKIVAVSLHTTSVKLITFITKNKVSLYCRWANNGSEVKEVILSVTITCETRISNGNLLPIITIIPVIQLDLSLAVTIMAGFIYLFLCLHYIGCVVGKFNYSGFRSSASLPILNQRWRNCWRRERKYRDANPNLSSRVSPGTSLAVGGEKTNREQKKNNNEGKEFSQMFIKQDSTSCVKIFWSFN